MPASTALVNVGKGVITARVGGTSSAVPQWVAWGTGSTSVTLGDTGLTTEDSAGSPAYARISGTVSQTTITTTADTYTVVGTLTANGTKTISECGLFTAVTSGSLFVRAVLASPISVALNDTVQFTFNVQFSSAVV